ncbi:arginase [Minwuia sp.]|uniref:arginase n=1 Tax=Minwuia sp. TaxID=2493630 RepID=UPI003A909F05
MSRTCHLLGAPVQSGAGLPGCQMGPEALRTAGLEEVLQQLEWEVTDLGDIGPDRGPEPSSPNPVLHNLAETVDWIRTLSEAAYRVGSNCDVPIFLGGDHSLSGGTVPAMARRAADNGQPLFVLWLDAHPDLHTLGSTTSGNLHGTPVAYFTGAEGFESFPPLTATVDPKHIMMMGIRSVDPAESRRIQELGMDVIDMRAIDERGVVAPLRHFLERVAAENGQLHVSFDVDFLDPAIAPAVGTTVPGGPTFREAHLITEMLADSGLVTSLDLVELNPFLDERGRTAMLMTDLTASLFGRRILDGRSRDLTFRPEYGSHR